ncbi:MAG TPA: hypothetical protein VEP73_00275, partial [Actinomycetota bacterium]|nr:hypothetical protein [Actinomycetota bacterium]
SGLADLSALELGAKLIGDRQTLERARSMGSDGRHSLNESVGWRPLLPVEDLRRLRPGEGVLVYGHLRPTPVRLRPYYTPAEQRRRVRLEDRAERRLARAEAHRERATAHARERTERARPGAPERPGWAGRLRVLRPGGRDARQREEG